MLNVLDVALVLETKELKPFTAQRPVSQWITPLSTGLKQE
jgi:hypothetical protein